MSDTDTLRREAVTAGLKAARLDESDRATVEFYLDRADDSWRECCGSDCIPCVSQVAQAVDVARARVRRGTAK